MEDTSKMKYVGSAYVFPNGEVFPLDKNLPADFEDETSYYWESYNDQTGNDCYLIYRR